MNALNSLRLNRLCQFTNNDEGFYSHSIYFKNRLRDKHSQNVYVFWYNLSGLIDTFCVWYNPPPPPKKKLNVRKQWVLVISLVTNGSI